MGEFDLAELRALIGRASLYVGGDSGPLHVAGTTDVPVVGLYGPTLPVRSQPWRSASFINEIAEVGPLPCRPCDQRRCEPGDFRCLSGISPELVAQLAERALSAGLKTSPTREDVWPAAPNVGPGSPNVGPGSPNVGPGFSPANR
jgi:ADP-heptose:LPS heptosyltransferase